MQELFTSVSPPIAFDVTYRVQDPEGRFQGEVSGHKFLLALASPVFRRGFYGTDFKEKKTESIEMKGTTLKAFKAFICVIYRQPFDLKNMSVTETFDLMNLAERYDLPKLKKKLNQELETMVLSKDSVVEAANTAMKFHQLEEVCQALLNNCAKTLARELDTKEAVVKFCSSAYGTQEETIVLKLMSMMNNLMPPPPPCSNCQFTRCQSGTPITSVQQVRAGTLVAPNPKCKALSNWTIEQRGKTVVKSTTEKLVIVEEGTGVIRYTSGNGRSGCPIIFLFYCYKG